MKNKYINLIMLFSFRKLIIKIESAKHYIINLLFFIGIIL